VYSDALYVILLECYVNLVSMNIHMAFHDSRENNVMYILHTYELYNVN
jgi:hypothetical protein